MADINKITTTYTDGTTVITASILNELKNKINEVIDKVNGSTPVTVATPVIIISGNSATITCATSGATIRYTTNGSTPTSSSTQYTGAITLSGATTIKAIAIKDGVSSSVATQSYTPASVAAPTITINGNSCTMSAESGATIYYTLNGSNPTTSSSQYSSAVTLQSACTVKAIAVKSGVSSSVASQPFVPLVYINFEDSAVESICLANFDRDNDGHISTADAAAVTSLGGVFKNNTQIVNFRELHYFTNVELGQSEFTGCTNLVGIELADSMDFGYSEIFKSCENMELAALPANLTRITTSCFYYCAKMTANIIPASVTQIDDFAFYMCGLLLHIKCMPATPPTLVNKRAFGVKSYGQVLADVYVPDASFDTYKVANVWSEIYDAGKLHKLSDYPNS